MKLEKLINWSELSRHLSGSYQNVRPNKIPKKYAKQVERLMEHLEMWERYSARKEQITTKK